MYHPRAAHAGGASLTPLFQVVTADGNRNRQRNYDECVEKLCEIMKEAATMPKDWNKSSKTKEKFNAVRLTEKKLHSNKKKQRNDRIDY